MIFRKKIFWKISNKLNSDDAFERAAAGFTIIELMVTISIIVIMTVLAIPAFSTYEKNVQWENKKDEIASLINETALRAKNPEREVTHGYVLAVIGTNSIELRKDMDRGFIKSVTIPNDYQIDPVSLSLVCPVSDGKCCLKSIVPSTGEDYSCSASNGGEFFKLINMDIKYKQGSENKQVVYNLTTNPFKLNLSEN